MANSTFRTLQADAIDGLRVDRNFISNGSATNGVSGWSTYADAAGTSPVDGTGGSPTVTFTRTTSSPLVGSASFLLTKDAANRQGQGASFAFTIDSAYQARVLQIEFDYILASGTFTAGSTSADSDVTVWIYDVTNAVVIQPTTYKLFSNSSTVSSKFVSNFQTAANSTSYRLIFHVGTTSASAFSLELDEIKVTPSKYVYGTPITDWGSWTPSVTYQTGGATNVTWTGQIRRVGKNLEGQVRAIFSATPAAFTVPKISMPSGLSVDTSSITQSANGFTVIGYGAVCDAGTANYPATLTWDGSTIVFDTMNAAGTYATNQGVTNTVPIATIANGDTINGYFTLPVAGWSSSVQTSDQSDSRVVAARYTTTAATSVSSSAATIIDYTTKDYDTHNAVTTGASWKFTAPVAGYYRVSAMYTTSATASSATNIRFFIDIYKNGSSVVVSTMNAGTTSAVRKNPKITEVLYLNAGDYIHATQQSETETTHTLATGARECAITIDRIAQASLISATETVVLTATTSTTTVNSTATDIIFSTKEIDTHNAYNTTTGIYTVPVSGVYNISAHIIGGTTSSTVVNESVDVRVYVNGSSIASVNRFPFWVTGTTVNPSGGGSITYRLSAGDQVKIVAIRGSNVSSFAITGTGSSRFNISRIGI